MYYVTTSTERYDITTSYTTEKQARRYGGAPRAPENLHLMDDGFTAQIVEYCDELQDIGKVRTLFESKLDGRKAGNFLLYLQDEEGEWYFSGIHFASYSDANQAVKGPLSGTFGDMLILEVEEGVTPTSKEEQKIYDSESKNHAN